MGHEVLDKILSIENNAERMIQKAKDEALLLQKQADQEIEQLRMEGKKLQLVLKTAAEGAVNMELQKMIIAADKSDQKKLEKINTQAEKNFQKTKDFIIKKIFA